MHQDADSKIIWESVRRVLKSAPDWDGCRAQRKKWKLDDGNIQTCSLFMYWP